MDSNLNLDILPPEVITQFLLRLSLEDLVNYCQTSKAANEYCKDNAFWRDKYKYDFGLPIPKNPTKLWVNLYKERMRKNSPVSASSSNYAVIDNEGILYMGGKNSWGQLGDGTRNNSKIPIAINFLNQKVISVSCGEIFTMAITEDGKTYGWGYNQFIKGSKIVFTVPTLIPKLVNYKAVKVSCGGSGWGVILDDGSAYVSIEIYLDERYVEINDRISLEDKIIDISVNGAHLAVVTGSGKLYFAGDNFSDRSPSERDFIGIEISEISEISEITENERIIKPKHIPFPPQQGIIPKIKQVSLTKNHIMVLVADGKVYIWGENYSGYLGLPYNHDFGNKSNLYLSPQLLTSLPKISYISTYGEGSAAITTDGRLYVWGRNKMIETLSNIQPDDKRFGRFVSSRVAMVPVEIDIGSRVNYIALGEFFPIASTVDGMVNLMQYNT